MRPSATRTLLPMLAAIILAGCEKTETHPKALTPVKAAPADLITTSTPAKYSANISPNREVAVACRLGGFVESLDVIGNRAIQEGDFVHKGAVLATLRQADYTTKVKQAEAQLAQASAALEAARAQLGEAEAGNEKTQLDLTRARNLFGSKSLTKSDFDGAKANADASVARVAAANAQIRADQSQITAAEQNVKDAQLAIADSEIKAPMDGVVLKKNIEVGSLTGPGTVAFVLADTSSVKAVFGVPDTLLESLHMGTPLNVTAEAMPNSTFSGRITNISQSADVKSRVFDVEVTIPNGSNRLKTGMIATVSVSESGATAQVLAIPLTAVVRSPKNPDQFAVFVLTGGDTPTAQIREVRLGSTYGNSIAVLEGLKQGERVITVGSTLVSDGAAVQLVP